MVVQIIIFLTLFKTVLAFGDLTADILPTLYTITLDTNFQTWRYTGYEEIYINVARDTEDLVMHSTVAVVITELRVSHNTRYISATFKKRRNAAKDVVVYHLSEKLKKNAHYVLHIKFNGEVSKKLTGYYRTGYIDKSTKKYIKMTGTHLSPDKSRTVFPCFDEPQFRAKFKLITIHPSILSAISNMPVKNTKSLTNGRTQTEFHATPPMSTYLLAWVHHNFVSATVTVDGVRISHWIRPHYKDRAKEKAVLIGKAIHYFNNFFGLKYPLPKLDSIGIPNYLVGGMENWGLITMKEETSLSTPESRYGKRELSYRLLLTHEVSHMWFGNLVTMKWWNDLWLKEGMATFLQFESARSIFHDADMASALLQKVSRAMNADKVITSHSVEMPIKTTKQITQIFDTITYGKGAAVLSMLKEVLGPAKFKKGMTDFLKSYQYSVADYNNLMKSMTKGLGSDASLITKFMNRYVLQKNFPIISVKKVNSQNIRLTQKRFVRFKDLSIKNDTSPYNYRWIIPIDYKTDTFKSEKKVMMTGEHHVIQLKRQFKWIKLNNEGKMMFVTLYEDTSLMDSLHKSLRNSFRSIHSNTQLSAKDRAQLLRDLFLSAEMKLIRYDTVLNIATYLKYEPDAVAWGLAATSFEEIRAYISGDLIMCLRTYVHQLVSLQYKVVRNKRKGRLQDQLKWTAFYRILTSVPKPHTETKVDEALLKATISKYKQANEFERRNIGIFLETTDKEQVIAIGNTVAKYPSRNVFKILSFIYRYANTNPEAVWQVYRYNYDVYNKKFGLAQFSYASALKYMISHQRSETVLTAIQTFFNSHTAGAGALGVERGLEKAKYGIYFRSELEGSLRDYLESKPYCGGVWTSVKRSYKQTVKRVRSFIFM